MQILQVVACVAHHVQHDVAAAQDGLVGDPHDLLRGSPDAFDCDRLVLAAPAALRSLADPVARDKVFVDGDVEPR
jgi:hypothetical protein